MRPLLYAVAVARSGERCITCIKSVSMFLELTASRQLLFELVALGLAILLELHDLGDVLIDLRLSGCIL
jgi:hypothetical protein